MDILFSQRNIGHSGFIEPGVCIGREYQIFSQMAVAIFTLHIDIGEDVIVCMLHLVMSVFLQFIHYCPISDGSSTLPECLLALN